MSSTTRWSRKPATTPATIAIAAILGMATIVGGCGLPGEDEPRAIDPPRGPFQALVSPSPVVTVTGAIPEYLYLVKDGMLVQVTRRVETTPTIDTLIADLVRGPTDTETRAGLTSSLQGSTLIAGIHTEGSQAIIELTPQTAGRTDEVIAFAQLVCTLTARPEITGVTFMRDQQPVGVPRGDGSLSQGPLTASDYISLITSQ